MGGPYKISQKQSLSLYSKLARYYDIAHHLQTLWADTKHRKLVARSAGLDGKSNCLDVGCGTGLSIVELSSLYKSLKITGIDISITMLKVAAYKLARLNILNRAILVNANAQKMPFDNNCFDAVTSTYGFGGIPDIEMAIKEVVRVLKPGGKVCFSEMSAPTRKEHPFRRFFHKGIVEPWIRYFWEFRDIDLITLFNLAGLIIHSTEFHHDRFFGSMALICAKKPL